MDKIDVLQNIIDGFPHIQYTEDLLNDIAHDVFKSGLEGDFFSDIFI